MLANDLRPRISLIVASLCLALAASGGVPSPASAAIVWFTVVPQCAGPCDAPLTAGTTTAYLVTAHWTGENPWTSYHGTVTFRSTDPAAILPESHTFTPADHGARVFRVTFRTAGWQQVSVSDYALPVLQGTSSGVQVLPAAPDHLAFTAGPSNAVARQQFRLPSKVAVLDAYGNVVRSAATVSLRVVAAPGATGSLTCVGGTSVAAVAGIATFSGCAIDAPGTGYRLSASAEGLAPAISDAFDVASAAPSPGVSEIAVAVDHGSVPYGSPVTITVRYPELRKRLVAELGEATAAAQEIDVRRREPGVDAGGEWPVIASERMTPSAVFTVVDRPTHDTAYEAVWVDPTGGPWAMSGLAWVRVRFAVVVAPASTTRIARKGATLRWTVRILPATPGVRVLARFSERVGSAWRYRATLTRTTPTSGQVTLSRSFPTAGRWSLTIATDATRDLASGWAPTLYVTVR